MNRSFVTLNSTVSVLWSALCADWNCSSVSVAFRWSDSCWRMTFSRIFERKCRLETGQQSLSIFLSNTAFSEEEAQLIACLKEGGMIPDTRDSLTMAVMVGIKSSRHSCTRYVRTGSSMHDFFRALRMMFFTCCSVIREKVSRMGP